jgi:quercetin dioxygenase-like cupin family protein
VETQNPYSLAPGKSRGGDPMLLRNKDSVSIKVSGSQTEGRIAIVEGFVSPGAGPILHLHHSQNESWYVLDGDFLFQVGDQKFRVHPGGTVFGPRGVPHAFRCVGKTQGKMLLAFDPAGQIEAFFAEIAKPGVDAGAGRHDEKEIIRRYGMEFVGPPLSDI